MPDVAALPLPPKRDAPQEDVVMKDVSAKAQKPEKEQEKPASKSTKVALSSCIARQYLDFAFNRIASVPRHLQSSISPPQEQFCAMRW